MRHSDEQEIYHLTPPLFIAMPLANCKLEIIKRTRGSSFGSFDQAVSEKKIKM
jgi:hypothetical protein